MQQRDSWTLQVEAMQQLGRAAGALDQHLLALVVRSLLQVLPVFNYYLRYFAIIYDHLCKKLISVASKSPPICIAGGSQPTELSISVRHCHDRPAV